MGFFSTRTASATGAGTSGATGADQDLSADQAADFARSAQSRARDAGAHAVYRLQVGLFGLGGMLLLIGLANIIMDRAKLTDQAATGPASAMMAASPSPSETAAKDPLVDMGVAPELPIDGKSGAPAGQRPAQR